MRKRFITFVVQAIIIVLGCGLNFAVAKDRVVVYTALDQIFSEPILQEFESRYNIDVQAVYDIEAVKTTGLVNRLIAEKNNPRCDVFWNNEIMRTIALKRKGILERYISPTAADIPSQFKDDEGYWTGFAARARVLVVNTDLLAEKDYPTSIDDLKSPNWQGMAAMANPLFGTTSTHAAAMFATQGTEQSETYLTSVKANKVKIVDGNSVVRDMTASGAVHFGITDTDDVNVGIRSGMPIAMVVPDQEDRGTLVIPNTVSIIKNSPNPDAARLLVDFLLSREVEEKLAHSGSAQIPLRQGIAIPEGQLSLEAIRPLQVDYEEMADAMAESVGYIQNIFLR